MGDLKYTQDDISRIFDECVEIEFHKPKLKTGIIAECVFTFPNGNKHAWVECGFPMYESNHDEVIAQDLMINKAKEKVWKIAGQYTLATGEKL